MILKPEFAHMVDRMGLEDGELALAEIVWEKAERAMQGQPLQEAVLIKRKPKLTPVYNSYDLTQAELQTLTDGLKLVLRADEQVLNNLKMRIDWCWQKSNPDDKDTTVYFDKMNLHRNDQRKLKKQHTVVAKIQHKLKKSKGK